MSILKNPWGCNLGLLQVILKPHVNGEHLCAPRWGWLWTSFEPLAPEYTSANVVIAKIQENIDKYSPICCRTKPLGFFLIHSDLEAHFLDLLMSASVSSCDVETTTALCFGPGPQNIHRYRCLFCCI